ncbi:MAG: GNAT family N-acetyltransferase [Bacteroidota bacterium]
MLSTIRTTSNHVDFQNLVVLLDAFLKITDGDDHAFYDQYNKVDAIKNVVVVYFNNEAVGCGAFKEYDSETVEIKRMFVKDTFRGKGIASVILSELELWAKENGYSECILETGIRQTSAIALYSRLDYKVIPNYGPYQNVPESVCMKKSIG